MRTVERSTRQLQDAARRCTDRTRIVRFAIVPVAATRWPTYVESFSALAASTTSTEAERFLRKPDVQLRNFGASAPDVCSSQNVSSRAWRQPSIVAGGGTPRIATGGRSGTRVWSTGFRGDVDRAAGVVGDSTARALLPVETSPVRIRVVGLSTGGFDAGVTGTSGANGRASSLDPAVSDGTSALGGSTNCENLGVPIRAATPRTQTTVNATHHGSLAGLCALFAGATFLDRFVGRGIFFFARLDRVSLASFAGTANLLSEIR